MSDFLDERGGELRELFFDSSEELLQLLNDAALKVEQNPAEVETVREIRRIVHTLKGDAAACGFRELSELAHILEDALAIPDLQRSSLAEVAFTAADVFHEMLYAYRQKRNLPTTDRLRALVNSLVEPLTSGKARKKKVNEPKNIPTAWAEAELAAAQSALQQGRQVFHVVANLDPQCAMPIAARQLIITALSSTAEILATRPDRTSLQAAARMELLVATEKSAEQVSARCKIPTVVSDVEVVDLSGTPKKTRKRRAAEAGTAVSDSSPSSPMVPEVAEMQTVPEPLAVETKAAEAVPSSPVIESSLRVDAERIDAVLNLVGELIIGKSMLQQALNEFAKENPKEAMRGKFSDAMAFQARVLNDLQRSVMKIRMVPVEQLLRRFPRMVRDVAKQCGKDIELIMSGQDTDLDKSLLDSIAEPLTHIVRNAVSHGIETPADRLKSGKTARGTLQLKSHHQGNQVVVEIVDDGRGIDAQKVRATAVQRGLLSAEEASRLTEAESLEFIFRPGVSTAEEITEVSGRGVGLDVVRSVLQRLKGVVEVESRPGQGTTFRLKLPLTLAIIKALLFRVDQRLYAIPLNAVAEIARAREADLHQVDHYEVLQLRNQVLPLVRLGRRPSTSLAMQNGSSRRIFVLVIQFGEKKLGLIVDELVGEEELVIKALDDKTVATDLVSGASILGDGRVVLIMNLAAILERFNRSRADGAGGMSAGMLMSSRPSGMAQAAGGRS